MTLLPLNDLYKLAPGPVPALVFVRVLLAVGVPMLGFTLAGQPVAGGATAMFVTLCDVGRSTPSRTAMMGLGTLAILLGGVAGDKFGGSSGVDEALVIASAFVAAWVSNSQPGLAVVARFGAVATAAGVAAGGTQWLIALLATLAAASSRLGMVLNPALGFACMTLFMVLAVDLLRLFGGGPETLVLERLYDVALGGALAVVGTIVAGSRHRRALREPRTG